MYMIGVIIFWIVSAVVGLIGLLGLGRRLPVRVLVACGLGLFIVWALPGLDDGDPAVPWLIAPPLIGLGLLIMAVLATGPKRG